MPDKLPVLPDKFQEILNQFLAVRDNFQVMRNKFQAVLDKFLAIPDKFQAVLNKFQGVRNKFQLIPEEFQAVRNDFSMMRNNLPGTILTVSYPTVTGQDTRSLAASYDPFPLVLSWIQKMASFPGPLVPVTMVCTRCFL